jgi:hypothetical protein
MDSRGFQVIVMHPGDHDGQGLAFPCTCESQEHLTCRASLDSAVKTVAIALRGPAHRTSHASGRATDFAQR